IRVEDPLIHEAGVVVEEHPTQVVEPERCEEVWVALDGLLEPHPVLANGLRATRLDPGNDREAVAGGGPGPDRAVPAHLPLVTVLGNCDSLRLHLSGHVVLLARADSENIFFVERRTLARRLASVQKNRKKTSCG